MNSYSKEYTYRDLVTRNQRRHFTWDGFVYHISSSAT